MPTPKLTKFEHRIMEALWANGPSAIREIQEFFPEVSRPPYTTIQTMVYRLEEKGALRRTKKIGNAHIFEAMVSRDDAQRRVIDDLLDFFDGRTRPVMAHLVGTGKLTLADIEEAEKALRSRKEKAK